MISPEKGVEEFLRTAKQLSSEVSISLIGNFSPLFEDYYKNIVTECANFGISVFVGETPESVAKLLKRTKVTFLPFPDGISEKRGSALAAMLNESLVVSYEPINKIEIFDQICVMCKKSDNTYKVVVNVIGAINDYKKIIFDAKSFAKNRSWRAIAKSYMEILF